VEHQPQVKKYDAILYIFDASINGISTVRLSNKCEKKIGAHRKSHPDWGGFLKIVW
jgi:hypothetical protein